MVSVIQSIFYMYVPLKSSLKKTTKKKTTSNVFSFTVIRNYNFSKPRSVFVASDCTSESGSSTVNKEEMNGTCHW